MLAKDDDENPCEYIRGDARKHCESGRSGIEDPPTPDPDGGGGGGATADASDNIEKAANWLIKKINDLIAPKKTWAPDEASDDVFAPFLWLGEHIAVAIFSVVVVMCTLTAWQGIPRLKQMGRTTGWTMVAVLGMSAVPGVVALLNEAVSAAFSTLFSSNEVTLFGVIKDDLKNAADAGNPLVTLIVMAVLVVTLGVAGLVFLLRNPAILLFVCVSPLVLASLAKGGDPEAAQKWAQRLLGVMLAPLALIVMSPLVAVAKGSLVVDAALLAGADIVMLRMIFYGLPYIGPRMARAARSMVESRTSNPIARAAVKAGVPDFYEQENTPRGPRIMPTPGRALSQDADVLLGAYGVPRPKRPGRLTTESTIAQVHADAERRTRVSEARTAARSAHSARNNGNNSPAAPGGSGTAGPRTGQPSPAAPRPPATGSGPAPGAGPSTP